jgi:triacylglycerol lipase
VVLIHGYRDRPSQFRRMAADLLAAGLDPHCADLQPSDGSVPLEASAEQLARYVESQVGPTDPFAVVAFSMGAVVARHYLQHLGGLHRATALYAIAAPHHGTWWAHLGPRPGQVQLRPGSPFLQALAATEDRLCGLCLVSAWTPFDVTVVPHSSCRWRLAANRRLPVFVHQWMPYSGLVRRDVVRTLASCGGAATGAPARRPGA